MTLNDSGVLVAGACSIRRRQRGVGLVEVMIGMLIGMIALLIMLQMLSSSEGQKRTTLGADDAQNNGAISLYSIQRDLREAGYGVSELRVIGCGLTNLPGGASLPSAAPVVINPATSVIPAGDANTDRLLVVLGDSSGVAQGIPVLDPAAVGGLARMSARGLNGNPITTTNGENYYAWNPQLVQAGAYVFVGAAARASGACSYALKQVNPASAGAGVAQNATTGYIYSLGMAPRLVAYRVSNGNLTSCDYLTQDCTSAGNYQIIAENIVSLRAQYGRDTGTGDLDGILDTYDQTTPASACDWARVSAVRFVVVARGADRSTGVTTVAPTWAGSATAPLTLSSVPVPAGQSWQDYRYRTFETVVPLRNNVVWGLVQSSGKNPPWHISQPDNAASTGVAGCPL